MNIYNRRIYFELWPLYKNFTDHPRITVGPENPLRVEKDDAAQLHCNVDSKPTGNKYALKRYNPFYTPQY